MKTYWKKNRNRIWAAALVILLVAAAYFLPERLLVWGDRQLLDRMHMESQDEDREGFAESIQLTVPEKVMLLRSGSLTVMELDQLVIEGAAAGAAGADAPVSGGAAEQLWEARTAAVRGEIRSLQTLGGLPELWITGSPPEYTGRGDLLYLEPDSHMSFQVYRLSLHWESCDLDLLVDQQSGRILSFLLEWSRGERPAWGSRGASNFGSAWRDYWRMDSVSTGWYNQYTRSVLENMEPPPSNSGDYAAHDQITFMYDSQSLPVPLDCQGTWSRNLSIAWNR